MNRHREAKRHRKGDMGGLVKGIVGTAKKVGGNAIKASTFGIVDLDSMDDSDRAIVERLDRIVEQNDAVIAILTEIKGG